MAKRKVFKPERRRVNFILMDGGVGDHMASLVALKYITKQYPWITPLVWVPDYLIEFAKHVLPQIQSLMGYSDMKEHYNEHLTTKTTKWDGHTSPMKIHLLDYAFLKLCDENPGLEHKNYLQVNPDVVHHSNKRVIITTGYTAKSREWPAEEINKVSKYILDKGYQPVFIGQTKTMTGSKHTIEGNFDTGVDFSLGTNLINKTSLLEAAQIMCHASAVVGVDNGLLHLAGYTDTAIVGGFPSVTPEIRMPVRHNQLGWNFYPVVPTLQEGCNFCQERTNFLYGHDYRECIYADNRSSKAMTAEKFITQLEKILK